VRYLMGRFVRCTSWLIVCLLIAVPEQSTAGVRRAKRLFRHAERQYQTGHYQQALQLYLKAYREKPLAGFHFNIGQCYRNLGEYQRAIEHFRRYLRDSPRPRHQALAQELIAECEAALDEAEAARVEALKLRQQADPSWATAEDPSQTVAANSRSGFSPVFFWTGVGMTSALLLAATITGALTVKYGDDFNDPATPYQDLRELKDTGEALRLAANTTLVVGLLAAAATTVLYFFTDFGQPEESIEVSALPLARGGVVGTVGGQF